MSDDDLEAERGPPSRFEMRERGLEHLAEAGLLYAGTITESVRVGLAPRSREPRTAAPARARWPDAVTVG